MKYRTKSADVLNEADRFQRILEWTLFTMEQENLLWGPSLMTKWVPGDPIYKDPREIFYGGRGLYQDYYGHHVRDAIEEIFEEDFYWSMLCEDCDVDWRGSAECWMCGKVYDRKRTWWGPSDYLWTGVLETLDTMTFDFETFSARNRQMAAYMQAMTYAVNDAERTIRGVYNHFQLRDEVTGWVNLTVDFVQPYNAQLFSYMYGDFRPQTPSPFEREDKDIVLVEPVYSDVWEKPSGKRVGLPYGIDLSVPVVREPMIKPEGRNFTESDISWPNFTPITERRRS